MEDEGVLGKEKQFEDNFQFCLMPLVAQNLLLHLKKIEVAMKHIISCVLLLYLSEIDCRKIHLLFIGWKHI